MAPPNRQRNPALAGRPGRLKLDGIEDTIRRASSRSRSPANLSPISKDRLRRRSSPSTVSHVTEAFRRRSGSSVSLNTFTPPDQSMQTQPQTSQPFSPLYSQSESLPFPPFSLDESAIFTDDEPPNQGQSPVAQPSWHSSNWQSSAQPLQARSEAQSAKVKHGQMIRITVKTQTTEVPCIAKCYLNRQSSVVDNEFARNWSVKIHPVPRTRWKDAKHWCVLDVIDVETIGSIHQQLQIRLGKLSDQRFSVELGIEALKSLRLVDEAETVPPLSRSAPPSQYQWADMNSPYMQQQQQHQNPMFEQYMLTHPSQQQFPAGRNRALTVPSSTIPMIRIDTSFDNSLPVSGTIYDSGSGDSSPWDALSFASQSVQDDERSTTWSPAVSECGNLSSSFDTCMK